MRYFIDTEFIEDGHTIDLISVGIVAEDGRELYLENGQADLSKASPWVKENVLPHLLGRGLRRWRIAGNIAAFIENGDSAPEFWSWCSAYDWVVLCQLYGTMMDKPEGWPSYCRDLQQELDRLGISDDALPRNAGTTHDALADARWHRDIFAFLFEGR